MKKLSKHLSLVVIFCALYFGLSAQTFYTGQCTFVNGDTFYNSGKAVLESQYGWELPTSGTIRVLVIFAEVNYDTGTDPNPNSTPGWAVHSLPRWKDSLFDANVPTGNAIGTVTRYYQQASYGNFNVIGDYLLAPTNGGIFSVLNSQGGGNDNLSSLCSAINTAMNGTFVTGHSLNNVSYFDYWTPTGYGQQKTNSPNNYYDHVMIIWRNRLGTNGCGYGETTTPGNICGYNSDCFSDFVEYSDIPTRVARHEFAHMLYGDNNFHCGGGGLGDAPADLNYWIPLESGWSNLGLYNSSLLCWNAWDRQRMNWTAPGNTYNPSARNANNTAEVNGDLDASIPSEAGTYTLRDFVTTGDAIRIKLPFINTANEFPEYIWIENHNGTSMNSCQFDQWQYQKASCVLPAVYGLYMYVQVDKDTRSTTGSSSNIYEGVADYLRPITAEGCYDRSFATTQILNSCIEGANTNPYTRVAPNPLTGGGDQDFYTVDINGNGTIEGTDDYPNFVENQNGTYLYNLSQLGNTRQVFTLSGNNKIGVGTNPSSATKMNMVSYSYPPPTENNVSHIYLNGVSITILSQNTTTGNIQVQIRFDDVAVSNNVRWCGNPIVLDPVSTSSGYSLDLQSGYTITLDQGTTATQMNNPQTINGQEVFAPPTLFNCAANSWLMMEANSNFIVENSSTLELLASSKFEIGSGSVLEIKTGSTLDLEAGSTLQVDNGGTVIIDAGGTLIYNGGNINLSGSNSVLNITGNLSIGNNANFTFTGGGYIRFTSTSNPSTNITAGTNASITLQGSGQSQEILEVQQESIYPPSNLASFTLQNGKVIMDPGSRINPNGLSTAITVNNILLTSNTGAFNSHRGLVLFGQPNVTITNSIFQYGSYGIYAYLTYGGSPLTMSGCRFYYCDKGLFVHDKGVTLSSCGFSGNTTNTGYGLYAEAMAFSSTINTSSSWSNKYGIYFSGAAGSAFELSNSSVYNNQYDGVDVDGSYTFTALCNSINTNSTQGIGMTDGVSLNVSQLQNPQGGYNDISGNGRGINTPSGNLMYLQNNTSSGCNNFYTSTAGNWDIYGYLSGYSCLAVISGNNNKWTSASGQPVWGTNYELWTTAKCKPLTTDITISDPTPQAYQSCGGGGGDVVVAGDAAVNPFTSTNDVRQITTASFNNVYLGDAVQTAINDLTISNASGNNTKALSEFTEILLYPIANTTAKEDWLLQVSYEYLKTAAGLVFGNNQTVTNTALLQQVFNVQDKLISTYSSDSNYDKKLYTTLDKALIYRLTNNRTEALTMINAILAWAKPTDYAMLNHWICMIQTENDILTGVIKPENIQSTVESCNTSYGSDRHNTSGNTTGSNNSIVSGDTKMEIFPNPFNESTTIKITTPDNSSDKLIELYNVLGSRIKSYELKQGESSVIVNGSDIESGIYYVVLKINQKNVLFNKLILTK